MVAVSSMKMFLAVSSMRVSFVATASNKKNTGSCTLSTDFCKAISTVMALLLLALYAERHLYPGGRDWP